MEIWSVRKSDGDSPIDHFSNCDDKWTYDP